MKHKSRYREEEEEDYEEMDWSRDRGRQNGHRRGQNGLEVKEVDISEIPPQLLSKLSQVKPREGGLLSPDDLDADKEVWVLQCPQHIDLRTLLSGRKIHVNGTPTILNALKEEDEPQQSFESTAHSREDSEESASLLLPGLDGRFKMVSVPLKGYITIREHMEELPPPEIKTPRRRMHKLPKGIKERHPVYGVEFTHDSRLPKITCSPTKRKGPSESSKPTTLTFLEERLNGRLRKKQNVIEEAIRHYQEEVETPSKKKKSKKRKRQDSEAEEVEEQLEVQMSPVKARKRKKLKMDIFSEAEMYTEAEEVFSPHKSKKSKKSKSREG